MRFSVSDVLCQTSRWLARPGLGSYSVLVTEPGSSLILLLHFNRLRSVGPTMRSLAVCLKPGEHPVLTRRRFYHHLLRPGS